MNDYESFKRLFYKSSNREFLDLDIGCRKMFRQNEPFTSLAICHKIFTITKMKLTDNQVEFGRNSESDKFIVFV